MMVSNGSIRSDRVGSIARPLTKGEIETLTMFSRSAPRLAMLPILLASLEPVRFRRGAEGVKKIERNAGALLGAMSVLLTTNAREEAGRRKIHDAVCSLEDVSLDALEDLFVEHVSICSLIEIERMRRLGMLRGDWRLELEPGDGIRTRICARHAPPRVDA
jgi:hypothetical protein